MMLIKDRPQSLKHLPETTALIGAGAGCRSLLCCLSMRQSVKSILSIQNMVGGCSLRAAGCAGFGDDSTKQKALRGLRVSDDGAVRWQRGKFG